MARRYDVIPRRLLVTAALLLAVAPLGALAKEAGADDASTRHYRRDYRFTADWFTHAIPTWKRILAPYVGKPDLAYLEVGVFQGRSMLWILENVLTHPSSRITAIDVVINDAYTGNVELSGAADRITTLQGRSQEMMRTLAAESFDIIYVDGSHRGDDVLVDAVLAWALLRPGGTLIFDDYLWGDEWPAELTPRLAIDTFITLFRHKLDVVLRADQLALRKRKTPCTIVGEGYCSQLGRFAYHWKTRVLFDPSAAAPVELSDAERAIVERLIKEVGVGQTRIEIPPDLKSDPAFQSLDAKLRQPAP